MSFPSNLKRIRKNFRMNQEEFGERLGLSRDQVKRLENGQMEASISIAVKLEELTGIPVLKLYHELVTDAKLPTYTLSKLGNEVVREPEEELGYSKKVESPSVNDLMKLLQDIKKTLERQEVRITKLENDLLKYTKPF